ncbi:unnamed protein product [Coccothraustes coccothraustes]
MAGQVNKQWVNSLCHCPALNAVQNEHVCETDSAETRNMTPENKKTRREETEGGSLRDSRPRHPGQGGGRPGASKAPQRCLASARPEGDGREAAPHPSISRPALPGRETPPNFPGRAQKPPGSGPEGCSR